MPWYAPIVVLGAVAVAGFTVIAVTAILAWLIVQLFNGE